ncbi:hypothetical protein YC2023_033385 [Brassica napus]
MALRKHQKHPENPARPWGPHDFLAVLFGAKKCVEVNGVKKASKTPSESAFDLFYRSRISARANDK